MNAVIERKETLPAEQTEPVTLLQVIERAARDPNVDIDKMERLMQMHERMIAKQAEAAFNQAMVACQVEMRPISTNAENPQTSSKYANYAQLDKHLRPIYTKHGFAISYDEGDSPKAEYVRVLAYVSHVGGHTRTYHRDMPADGKGPKGGDVMTKTHAAGAAGSYGARYLLKGIFNVAIGQDDKDGNEVGPPINDKQAADLRALLSEVGADEARFLKYIKAASIEAIPAKNFDAVCKTAAAKRKKQS